LVADKVFEMWAKRNAGIFLHFVLRIPYSAR
jgi:hypothetical protein